jgi:glyoxylase I family protein
MPLNLIKLTPLLQVYDMPTALAFYRDRLGFEVIATSPEVETPEGQFSHWVWLRSGAAEIMLNTAYDAGERPREQDVERVLAHGDTCLFFACPNLDEVYAELQRGGVDCKPPVIASYGVRRFSVRDPDHFELVFQEAE